MKVGSTYKLDNLYLRCTRVRESGVNTFQVSDKFGIVLEPVYSGGLIVDHGTRLVYLRTDELILIK